MTTIVCASARLNSKDYRLIISDHIDGYDIQRYDDNREEWDTVADVGSYGADDALAWQTWAAYLIADRAGRM